MSRDQRRLDRRQQQTRGARPGGPPNRRTPVRAQASEGLPWRPLAIVGGVVLIAALIAYLLFQQRGGNSGLTAWEKAQANSSASIAGTFVPTQGRGHLNHSFSLEATPMPFCPGVVWSGAPEGEPGGSVTPASGTPSASLTPAAATTPTPGSTGAATTGTASSGTAVNTPTPQTTCYASNPPSSGQHLNVARNVDVTGKGDLINIPSDPDVYPDDIKIPREAIPHILEHAGIYIGWNCADGDQACLDAVNDLKALVNDRIDNHDDRVVMAHDTDIPPGMIGISSWTRYELVKYQDYKRDNFEKFISDNACRFDPEGFCG